MTIALMFYEILKIWAIKIALIVFVSAIAIAMLCIIFSLFTRENETDYYDDEFFKE